MGWCSLQIIAGAADKSYGIHVARLAGVPQQVIKRTSRFCHSSKMKTSTPKGK